MAEAVAWRACVPKLLPGYRVLWARWKWQRQTRSLDRTGVLLVPEGLGHLIVQEDKLMLVQGSQRCKRTSRNGERHPAGMNCAGAADANGHQARLTDRVSSQPSRCLGIYGERWVRAGIASLPPGVPSVYRPNGRNNNTGADARD